MRYCETAESLKDGLSFENLQITSKVDQSRQEVIIVPVSYVLFLCALGLFLLIQFIVCCCFFTKQACGKSPLILASLREKTPAAKRAIERAKNDEETSFKCVDQIETIEPSEGDDHNQMWTLEAFMARHPEEFKPGNARQDNDYSEAPRRQLKLPPYRPAKPNHVTFTEVTIHNSDL